MSGFNIDWWGNHYFSVNDKGHVEVCPDPDVPEARVDLLWLLWRLLPCIPNQG